MTNLMLNYGQWDQNAIKVKSLRMKPQNQHPEGK